MPESEQDLRSGVVRYELPVSVLQWRSVVLESAKSRKRHSVIVAGDSLNRFLPEYFRCALKLRPFVPYPGLFQELLPSLIEAEKPDIYIELLVDPHVVDVRLVTFPGK